MKETSYAYAAGLIDADGSLYISKSVSIKTGYTQYDPTIMVRSTHLPTVKWLVSKFGGTIDKSTWKDDRWKVYYRWKFTSDKHASRFLERVIPYLWLKQKQASLLREYYAMFGVNDKQKRETFYQRMTELNQNSSVTTNTSSLPLERNLRQAYFAGMFDGEGSLYIICRQQAASSRCNGVLYRASLCLSSTSEQLALELQKTYGGFVRRRAPHNGNLDLYEWDIKDNKKKEVFLLSILPYLVTKRAQGKIVLNFVRLNGVADPEARKSMWLRCCELNGRKRESDLMGDHESAPVVTQAA